jgi:hypothetical protein
VCGAASGLELRRVEDGEREIEQWRDNPVEKNQIKSLIQEAFNDVTLESGTSILQTRAIDEWPASYTKREFAALVEKDITHDWQLLTVEDLDKCEIAHLDDKGFRYYIPALMCSVLDSYLPASMRVIGTLRSLYPSKRSEDIEKYILARFEILNVKQRQAIAQFLRCLPELIELDTEDRTIVERSIRNYWKDYVV